MRLAYALLTCPSQGFRKGIKRSDRVTSTGTVVESAPLTHRRNSI